MTLLEHLDISVSKCTGDFEDGMYGMSSHLPNRRAFEFCNAQTEEDTCTLPAMRELRIQSDNQHSFSSTDLQRVVDLFPNLKTLGFAHMMLNIRRGAWKDLLKGLESVGLETLWLLDPREIGEVGALPWGGQHYHAPPQQHHVPPGALPAWP
jgi:hypothetical protein